MRCAIIAAFLLPAIAGFEAASIKDALPLSLENTRPGHFHVSMNLDGSRADYGFMSLADLIAYSYRVKQYQLSGPVWMNDKRWDILAKIPAGQSPARAPEMMRSLLAERFKLAVHRERRMQPVYDLSIGRGGLKMKKAASEDAAPVTQGIVHLDNSTISGGPTGTAHVTPGPNGIRLQLAKITMPALASMLTQFTDRPIVDSTKLEGGYEVTLDLPGDQLSGMPAAQKFIAFLGLGSIGMLPDPSGPAIFQAVKELGLELRSRKASLETIIVDHLEKSPTTN
jgi:uncharacterized protein (TIGR03435 family)